MKKILTFIVMVIVIVLAYLFFRSPAKAPEAPETLGSDKTNVITSDLEQVDIGDLDKEFQTIDQDLQSL